MHEASQNSSKVASVVVSNTSPLIALKHAGIIEVLNTLFQTIVVSPAVMDELSVKEKEYFTKLKFLKLEAPNNKHLVEVLKLTVDEGEAESITLALEKNAILIIDDLKGRRVARKLGIRIIGTMGLLEVMKLKGLLKKVKPYLELLKIKGFYISERFS